MAGVDGSSQDAETMAGQPCLQDRTAHTPWPMPYRTTHWESLRLLWSLLGHRRPLATRYPPRSEERRVGKVTGVQTCALPIFIHGIVWRWRNKWRVWTVVAKMQKPWLASHACKIGQRTLRGPCRIGQLTGNP